MSLTSSSLSSTASSSTIDDSKNISLYHTNNQQKRYINNNNNFISLTASSNNCLDKCPKCGQRVCEHTSIAEVINLPNSISQDFSTYSSDSSLIKQLFSDSSTGMNPNQQINISQNQSLTDPYQNKRISFNQNYYLNSKFFKNHCSNNFTLNNFMPSPSNASEYAIGSGINNGTRDVRPLSCQFMIIDNETTDKLLRDFFDSNAKMSTTIKSKQLEPVVDQLVVPLNSAVVANETEPLKNKKKKFSTFRIFMKSHDETSSKCTKKKQPRALKNSGFVNCLTSSGTSESSSPTSSCEKLKTTSHNKLFKEISKLTKRNSNHNDIKNSQIQESSIILNNKTKIDTITNKSITGSLNSKLTNELDYDEYDYNEIHNLELCPIAASDLDLEYVDDVHSRSNSRFSTMRPETCLNATASKKSPCSSSAAAKNIVYNNFHIYNNNANVSNITKNYANDVISVPLNNYLYYNYEKKGEINDLKNKTKQKIDISKTNTFLNKSDNPNNSSGSATTITDDSTNTTTCVTEIHRVGHNSSSSGSTIIEYASKQQQNTTKSLNRPAKLNNKTDLNQSISQQNLNSVKQQQLTKPASVKNSSNQHSYFSSCSSCDTSCTPTGTALTTKTNNSNFLCGTTSASTTLSRNSDHSNMLASPKYNSITIIFILMGLFTINFLQESILILYFYNTEQFYWFIYSIVAIFSGQTITLILSLLAEIDLINLSPPTSLTNFTAKMPSTAKNNEKKLKNDSIKHQPNIYINEYDLNYNTELYSVFKSPFSKLFLLVPGFLSISVYIQFFKHVFNYRKAPGHLRFKLEFQLSLYLFFNSVFHSLPLAIINSCFLASTTKNYSLSWYYTELFSIFKSSSSSFLQHTSYASSSLSSSISSASSQTQILVDSNAGLERRSNLVLLLVSIFISISIGICLFITYYELMKQMNFLSIIKNNLLFVYNRNKTGQTMFNPKLIPNSIKEHISPKPNLQSSKEPVLLTDFHFDQKLENLGLVEVLIYFCYRFCLMTSRLSVIALFWYLFNEWLLLAVLGHILIAYGFTVFTIKTNKSSTNSYILDRKLQEQTSKENKELIKNEKLADHYGLITESSSSSSSSTNGITVETAVISLNAVNSDRKKSSKLNQHLTLFIVCLLSIIDLFMNQLSELYHIRKVFVYYLIYMVQNVSILTYWLVRTILNAKNQLESENLIVTTADQHSNIHDIFKSSFNSETTKSIKRNQNQPFMTNIESASPATYACYATIIYLCIILFTIFGLVLKFLHLHILRKRFRRLYN